MNSPKRRASTGGTARSPVSTQREVDIGLHEVAPRNVFPSLDFDRVVNSYSIEATKKRLLIHQRLFASTGEDANQSYRTFQKIRGKKKIKTSLRMPFGKPVMTWVLTLLTGLICGLGAIIILSCVSRILGIRSHILNRQLQWITGASAKEGDLHLDYSFGDAYFDAIAQKFGMAGVLAELVIMNMMLALLSAAMCVYSAPVSIKIIDCAFS